MKLSDQKNKTTYQTKQKFSFPTCFQMLQLPHFCRKLIELIPRIRIPETDMEKVSSMQALLADNFWKIVEFFNKQLNFDSFSHQCPQVCIIILNQYIFVKIYSIYLKNWYTGHFYMPNFFHVWPESLVLFLSLGKMFLFSIQHIHTTSDGTNRLLAKSSPNFWRCSLLYQHFRRWPQPNVRNESALKMKATVGRYYEGSYPSQGFHTQPWFLRFAVTDRQTNLYSWSDAFQTLGQQSTITEGEDL